MNVKHAVLAACTDFTVVRAFLSVRSCQVVEINRELQSSNFQVKAHPNDDIVKLFLKFCFVNVQILTKSQNHIYLPAFLKIGLMEEKRRLGDTKFNYFTFTKSL